MQVKELLKVLRKCDPSAEVVMHTGPGEGEEYVPIDEVLAVSDDPDDGLVALRCLLPPYDEK